MALSLTGCTHEGPHTGCDEGSLNLLFTYDGNTAGFDQTIAEDIEFLFGKCLSCGMDIDRQRGYQKDFPRIA